MRKCENVKSQSQGFIDELKLCGLVGDIKLREDIRLCKQLQYMDDVKPHFLKELISEKYRARNEDLKMQRECRREHKFGISDPSRFAAKFENRLYFDEHIKKDDFGNKKHVVQK